MEKPLALSRRQYDQNAIRPPLRVSQSHERARARTLSPGGTLLFVVPTGTPRIEFNAHRIYSYDQVTLQFGGLTLREFALVPDSQDDGGLIRNASPAVADDQRYACGCYHFQKPRTL